VDNGNPRTTSPSTGAALPVVQEALNGVQMSLSLGGENVTVLDLDADFAAELAGLIEVSSQPYAIPDQIEFKSPGWSWKFGLGLG